MIRIEKFALTILLLKIAFYLSTGCKYEKLGPEHTMCVYAAKACPNSELLRSGGISNDDKHLIVDTHNKLRSSLAVGNVSGLPSAANMLVMSWDNELAEIAQRWADQCIIGHDKLRNTEKYYVGQNVALSWSLKYKERSQPEWESSIQLWIQEYQQFGLNVNHINPFKFKYEVGHFTQMIWGDTHKIGCGYSCYKHPEQGYTKNYVCNYAPGGNMIGQPMYEVSSEGAKCSYPSLLPSKEYQGLCEFADN